MTYDLGLMRMRDLTIRKVGTDGKLVEGATFAIYGHFYTITLIASWQDAHRHAHHRRGWQRYLYIDG